MRRLIGFLFQLAIFAIIFVAMTATCIVIYGLQDSAIQKADVALVFDHHSLGAGVDKTRLDRVVDLYKKGDFPFVIVSANSEGPGGGDALAMTTYLEGAGLPPSAILTDSQGNSTLETAKNTKRIMSQHHLQSVLVITDYYRLARTTLELQHFGVQSIEKARVGTLQKNDVLPIGEEVLALYQFLGTTYLLPEAKKVEQEAVVGVDKAKVEAEKAKESVDQRLNSMAK